jgi:hypothetical protein
MLLLLAVVTLASFSPTLGVLPTFCPIVSPNGDMVYVADSPVETVHSQTMLQCAVACAFPGSRRGATCQRYNYNSTSMECKMFGNQTKSVAVDKDNKTIGYQVR